MSGGYIRYIGSCVSLPSDLINQMVDAARPITRRTFLRHLGGYRARLAWLECELGYRRTALTMARDWHVAYYAGRYAADRCVFLVHSGIEYIWIKEEES